MGGDSGLGESGCCAEWHNASKSLDRKTSKVRSRNFVPVLLGSLFAGSVV